MSKRKRDAGNGVGIDDGGSSTKKARTNLDSDLGTMNESLVTEPQKAPELHQTSVQEERSRREAKRQRRREKKHRSNVVEVQGLYSYKPTQTANWNVSEALGGRLLDLDPVFSIDEQYAISPFRQMSHTYWSHAKER